MTNDREIELLPKLNLAITQQNWDNVSNLLDPKLFRTIELNGLIAFPTLAKVAEILTTDDFTIPGIIKIACLKCLGNSCFNGYKHKEYFIKNIEDEKCCHKLYSLLSKINEKFGESVVEVSSSYPYDSHFPYGGVAEWTSNYIKSCVSIKDPITEQLEILRLSIQFLCNLFTFACKDNAPSDRYNVPECLYDPNLKSTIVNFSQSDYLPLTRASCVFIHNSLKELGENYFTDLEKKHLSSKLLKPVKEGLQSAKDALLLLLRNLDILEYLYENVLIEDKLYLLEILYKEISESVYESQDEDVLRPFTRDTIQFLSERFCEKSDLILKTVDTYLHDMEPTEIIILLDILGVLTSENTKHYYFFNSNKNLLINCTYLLKSIQMVGKESHNFFTPMDKLSEVAPTAQGIHIEDQLARDLNIAENKGQESERNAGKHQSHPDSHPAFGFKAGLIRIIGNMSYKSKVCQDLLREMDAIPLLLDCCNIDARNPLIMQWTIFALSNLCEDNPENQQIIRNCTKVGIAENSVLKEAGLTLHEDEDGKKIGIVPLVRDKERH